MPVPGVDVCASLQPARPRAEPDPTLEAYALRVADLCLDPNVAVEVAQREDSARFELACRRWLGERCDGWLSFGLRRITFARYVDRAGAPRTVELVVSRFSGPDGAYAASSELLPHAPFDAPLPRTAAGASGVLLDGAGAFSWRGSELLQMEYRDPAETAARAVESAERVAGELLPALLSRLSGDDGPPRVVELLPEAQRLPWGVRLHHRDALGVVGAGPIAVGYYQDAGLRYGIFVASHRDEASAKDLMRALRAQPGRRQLEDVPFDAFESRSRWIQSAEPELWLIGHHEGRVAGVGNLETREDRTPIQGRATPRLDRTEKLRLLRRIFRAP